MKGWLGNETTRSPQDEGLLSLESAHLESEGCWEDRNQRLGLGINVELSPASLLGLLLYLSPRLSHPHTDLI